ncbi:MAG: hypothetical protein AAGK74_04280 [Chloroflexota bacterium]
MRYLTHTFRLWGLLTRPLTGNPLYERTVEQDHNEFNPFKTSNLRLSIRAVWLVSTLIVGAIFMLIFFPLNLQNTVVVLQVAAVGIIGLLALFMFTGTGSGALWAVGISSALHRAARTGMTDLLTVSAIESPRWIIAVGILHRSPIFRTMFDQTQSITLNIKPRYWIAGVVLVLVGLVAEASRDMVGSGVIIFAALMALYIDQVQSCEVAVLLSLWITARVDNENDIRTFALFGFLTVQLTAYITTALIFLWLFPQIGLSSGWGYGLPQIAVLYLSREWVIALLWRAVPPYHLPQVHADDADPAPVARSGEPR